MQKKTMTNVIVFLLRKLSVLTVSLDCTYKYSFIKICTYRLLIWLVSYLQIRWIQRNGGRKLVDVHIQGKFLELLHQHVRNRS